MGKHQILLADDDDALRAALGELLSRLGFGIVEASDGPAALDVARSRSVDLSILDFHMPGMSGLEVLRELQREWACAPTQPLPCILISADATPRQQQEALRQGAFRFLPKPFPVDDLLASVSDLLHAFQLDGNRMLVRLDMSFAIQPYQGSRLPAPLDQLFPFLRLLQRPPRRPEHEDDEHPR